MYIHTFMCAHIAMSAKKGRQADVLTTHKHKDTGFETSKHVYTHLHTHTVRRYVLAKVPLPAATN